MHSSKLFTTLLFSFSLFCLTGQTSLNSPLSYYGIGEHTQPGLTGDISFGNANTALFSSYMVNIGNPASYSGLYSQIADVAFRTSTKQIRINNSTYSTAGGAIHNFTYGFSLGKRLGMVLNLKPETTMNYNFSTVTRFGTSKEVVQEYNGEGGINKVMIGFGYALLKDTVNYLSLGVNAGHLFGFSNKTNTTTIIEAGLQSYNSMIQNNISVNDQSFDFGLQYVRRLNKKVDLTLGATYRPALKLNAGQTFFAASFDGTFNEQTIKDTVDFSDQEVIYQQNEQIGVGIGLDIDNRFKVLFDYKIQRGADNLSLGSSFARGDISMLNLGFQYIPDYENVMKILQVIRYRAGFSYANTGIMYQGAEITKVGGTIGLGIPLVKSQSLTSFNFGMEIGNMSNGLANSYQEFYSNLYIGISIAPHKFDKWFIRRKID